MREFDADDWLPADVDTVLDAVMPLDTQREFDLMLTRLAQQMGRASTVHWPGHPLQRMLWGLATRLKEYTPTPGRRGTNIDQRQATHVQRWMIKTAVNTKSDEAKEHRAARPDAEYLANLLRMPIGLVRQVMQEVGPGRGRAGFGLIDN